MSKQSMGGRGKVIWTGRPSVSILYGLYGLVTMIVISFLIGVEIWSSGFSSVLRTIFPRDLILGGSIIPYPVEIASAIIVVLAYLGEVVHLVLLRARHKYELYEDGLYVDAGIVNLQNTYISPMAFSDARLDMPWSLRLLNRGNMIIDSNDNRHFKLIFIENPLLIQNMIRRTLGHPIVRVESLSSL